MVPGSPDSTGTITTIPDGASVDYPHGDTVIVRLPDGTSYTLPLCGDGTEIALEGSGLAGQVTVSRAGVEIQIAARYLFMQKPSDYHVYGFANP